MSVLRALTDQYERLRATSEAPEYGYSREPVSFAIVLARDGTPVDVSDIRDTSGKSPRAARHLVPRPVVRAVNVAPNFLWDKTPYALGMRADNATGAAAPVQRGEHDAFRSLHTALLAGTDDPGLTALASFLETWRPERYADLRHAEQMLGANVVFRLDGEMGYLHQRPASRRVWEEHLAAQGGERGICLVTGRDAPLQRLHAKIKGVRGAQTSGASIVSFNLDAFESFGRKQGANAQVSERSAFAYTAALNTMLARDSGRSIRIADTTTLFWASALGDEQAASAAEATFSIIMDPPSPSDAEESVVVADALEKIAQGRALSEVRPDLHEDTRFFVLGLAPNAARVSVRFWHEDTFGTIARRVAEHWQDLRIDPWPWRSPPPVWSLLLETAPQHKADNIPPLLGGAMMRAILTGARYPQALLAAVVARMRADRDVNGRRAAICKACLTRAYRLRHEEEDIPVSLDPDNTNPAYRLGRLFALYENLQRAALGGQVNATIKDRYFGAAMATPASIFPLIERNSANHLAALRKDKGGLAHWFDREIDAVLEGLDGAFPRSLRLEEQGRFAIGYHHQRARRGDDSTPADARTETV